MQISPPLVAGEAELDEIVGILGDVLGEAAKRVLGAGLCRSLDGRVRLTPLREAACFGQCWSGTDEEA